MQPTADRNAPLRFVPVLCMLAVYTALVTACGGYAGDSGQNAPSSEIPSLTGSAPVHGTGGSAIAGGSSAAASVLPSDGASSEDAAATPSPSNAPAGLPDDLLPDADSTVELPVAETDNRFRKTEEVYLREGTSWRDSVELDRITPDLWLHVTYTEQADRLSASNGLVVFQEHGALLVNTPGNAEQTYRLLDLVRSRFGVDVTAAVVTSPEPACMGGVNVLEAQGVPVLALKTVADGCPDAVREKLQILPDVSTRIIHDDREVVLLQPDAAAGPQDSLLWLPQVHALYSRSLLLPDGEPIPESAAPDLLWSWRDFLTRWMVTRNETEIFIPGSGEWGTRSMLDLLIGRITEKLPANVTGSALELFLPKSSLPSE